MMRPLSRTCVGSCVAALFFATASCVSAGKPAPQPSALAGEFAYYVRVAQGLWSIPLGIEERELSLRTDFFPSDGLDHVSIDVLGDVNCDMNRQQAILTAHLALYNHVGVICSDYHEPGGARVDATLIDKRIASALAFAKSEWAVVVSGPFRNVERPGEPWESVRLAGPRYEGVAFFDTTTGSVVAVELNPKR